MIRRLGYEFFKATHFLAVVVFVVVFFWHCDYTLTSWHYFVATAAIYVPCFVYPWLRTAFEYGYAQKAYVHVKENGFIRLTIPSVNMRWKPGQHCFLRFTSFGFQAFSSHPFTICSLPSLQSDGKSDLVFYIRQSHGLTKRLYGYSQKHPATAVSVLIDGPYGGINLQRFNDADRLLVIAGGSGAGWTLSLIELFHRQRNSGFVISEEDKKAEGEQMSAQGPFSMRVVLATRDTSSRIWFLQTVAELLAKYSSSQSLSKCNIEIHLTGEAKNDAVLSLHDRDVETKPASASSSADNKLQPLVQEKGLVTNPYSGRPDLPSLIRQEGVAAAEEGQNLSVFVCGPTTMQHEVRNAVAEENLHIFKGSKARGVYLHSEHFSWA
ncbi:hypothetical protein N0V94_007003 [Neodidymelliopsis sp. IMI 364377]|nr:hypothetical protein N0V94_007003 [Neodidymelliopsis sp. IMI 364377]